jgi:hypothetical protein
VSYVRRRLAEKARFKYPIRIVRKIGIGLIMT